MSLLTSMISDNPSSQTCFSALGTRAKQQCQKICSLFANYQDSVDTVRYAQNKLSASEKIKKQLLFALKNPNQHIKSETRPFSFPDLMAPIQFVSYAPLKAATAQHIGSREEQEDGLLKRSKVRFTWKGDKINASLFGVFDGHGDGGNVSHYLNQNLIHSLERLLTKAQDEYEELNDEVICNAFTQVFHDLSQSYQGEGGAVITCAFVIGNAIYIPNVGDSRTILIKPNKALCLTEDGVAEDPRFQKWHLDRGHEIVQDKQGTARIWANGIGGAMFARDIGNPMLCSRPKITKVTIGNGTDNLDKGAIFCKKGDFLLLASDGLAEAATITELGNAVRRLVQLGIPLDEIANLIASKAGNFPGNDNVTVQIIPI